MAPRPRPTTKPISGYPLISFDGHHKTGDEKMSPVPIHEKMTDDVGEIERLRALDLPTEQSLTTMLRKAAKDIYADAQAAVMGLTPQPPAEQYSFQATTRQMLQEMR